MALVKKRIRPKREIHRRRADRRHRRARPRCCTALPRRRAARVPPSPPTASAPSISSKAPSSGRVPRNRPIARLTSSADMRSAASAADDRGCKGPRRREPTVAGDRAEHQHGEDRLHADLRDVEGQLHAPLFAVESQCERSPDDGGDGELRGGKEEEPEDQRDLAERHGVHVAPGRHVDQQQLTGGEQDGDDEESPEAHRVPGVIRRHEREAGREGEREHDRQPTDARGPTVAADQLLPARLGHLHPSKRVDRHASDRHGGAPDVVGVCRWSSSPGAGPNRPISTTAASGPRRRVIAGHRLFAWLLRPGARLTASAHRVIRKCLPQDVRSGCPPT